MKVKGILSVLIIGGVGGLAASFLLVPFLVKTNFLNSAELLSGILAFYSGQNKKPSTTASPTPVPVPSDDNSSSLAIENIAPSVVAIQSFNEGRLISSGSGLILTQDGLVGTVISAVPISASVFQIIYSDKAYPAKVVLRDRASGLAIIAFAAEGLKVAKLAGDIPPLGYEFLIFSKIASFGHDQPLVAKTIVSRLDDSKNTFGVQMEYDPKIIGSAAVNKNGAALGLVSFSGKQSLIIPAGTVNDVLNKYLTKKNN